MECKRIPEVARDLGDLPPVLASDTATGRTRSGQLASGAGPAVSRIGRSCARSGSDRKRPVEREDVWSAGAAAATLAWAGSSIRRFARLEAERRRRPISPGSLHRMAAHEPLSFHGHVRRAEPGSVRAAPAAKQHAAASPGNSERSGVRGSSAGAGRQNGKSRRSSGRETALRFPTLPGATSPGRRIKTIAGFLRTGTGGIYEESRQSKGYGGSGRKSRFQRVARPRGVDGRR